MALDGHRVAGASPGGEDARALPVLEAADARSDDQRTDERRDTARHVHDARACKVDLPAQQRRAVARVHVEGRRPAVGVPHPVHDDGVDEAGDHGGVDQVGRQLGALGDGAGHDGRCGGGEDVLKEPEPKVAPVWLARGGGVGSLGAWAGRPPVWLRHSFPCREM